MAVALQVGQVILTLPHSLAETNIIAGTFLQLTFATCGPCSRLHEISFGMALVLRTKLCTCPIELLLQ